MELLLNLAWLFLAVPAFWLWHDSRTSSLVRKFTALQCVLALGCMLVILFPVVSATDDLCAMRNEMEESPASKRTIRLASNDKALACRWQNPPALAATAKSVTVGGQSRQPLPTLLLSAPVVPPIERASRAPPRSLPRSSHRSPTLSL
jgi:hypothetical protein